MNLRLISLCVVATAICNSELFATQNLMHMNEAVIFVPVESDSQRIILETTIFKPDGYGPFPLIVINHGKSKGLKPRNHQRARYIVVSLEFVRRGYVVALPMRQGFSRSEGSYIDTDCNIESDGQIQAGNVAAIIDYLKRQPYLDKDRIVVAGYSSGGLVTLALGARNIPGVRGLINFSGGIRINECDDWRNALVWAVTRYARATRIPSLWFYGDNDRVFAPYIADWMYQQYTKAGGKVRLVNFGKFDDDAHLMFIAENSPAIWVPEVEQFLETLELPFKPIVPRNDVRLVPKQQFKYAPSSEKDPFRRW